MLYSIGEFSRITGLSVKTLRFYHEQNVLVPTHVDQGTGYRSYGANKIETARIISQLRKLDFSLAQIVEILRNFDDDGDILEQLNDQDATIRKKIDEYREISRLLNQMISKEKEARTAMQKVNYDIQTKTLDEMLIAGVRMKAKYSECGKGFGQIGRKFGRMICGKPLILHYDTEYKEEDADFEACMPIKKGTSKDGVDVRKIPGGKCISLMHLGPYDELGRSYEKLFNYAKENGLEIQWPTREVYIKGPGMIFRGNPQKYLTEIQLPVKD